MHLLFFAIFVIYGVVRITTNLSSISRPRELADTVAYLRVSRENLTDVEFWGDARPFVFPLLLKIASQDVSQASVIQLGLSMMAWGALAFAVSTSLRAAWLQIAAFIIILSLSLVRHLASWDYVMMTESLSVSFFVLVLTLGIWLTRERKPVQFAALIVAGVFFAFTRDTNAYVLLMLAGLLVVSIAFRWAPRSVSILAFFFLSIFFLNNYISDLGARWVFPLNNNIGRRILPDSQALEYFRACGMPVTQNLLAMTNEYANGRDRAFYHDPALETYREWLGEHGKSCYMKWLLADPFRRIGEALYQFEALIRFEKVSNFYAKNYQPVIPNYAERFLYPKKFTPAIWVILTLGALLAMYKKAWGQNPLWGVYILLCLPILPHLFITWHGDAMAPERHALSVGLQVALCFWLFLFLVLEQLYINRLSAK